MEELKTQHLLEVDYCSDGHIGEIIAENAYVHIERLDADEYPSAYYMVVNNRRFVINGAVLDEG